VRGILAAARAPIVAVSLSDPAAAFSAADVEPHPDGTRFTLFESGRPAGRLSSPLIGTHNLRNAVGAIALARGLGLSVGEIANALPRFAGVRRRLEVKGERNGILVVDDFAHHPTAVAGTIAAARTRWPGRRIWALFEPRSNTAGRKLFQDDYGEAFSGADALVIGPIFHAKRLKPEERIDRSAVLSRFMTNGKPAYAPESLEEMPAILRRAARPGDVLLLMSSGAFGGLPETLLGEL
jgi:UDP-N-acetylmuramate: L-alanyl-gamma-D-glutamyl-meso-diaminopimelate ligase